SAAELARAAAAEPAAGQGCGCGAAEGPVDGREPGVPFRQSPRDTGSQPGPSSGVRSCPHPRASFGLGIEAIQPRSGPPPPATRRFPAMTRVHQVLATLGYGDAIGHEVLGIQQVLRDRGYESEIFVETADERLEA